MNHTNETLLRKWLSRKKIPHNCHLSRFHTFRKIDVKKKKMLLTTYRETGETLSRKCHLREKIDFYREKLSRSFLYKFLRQNIKLSRNYISKISINQYFEKLKISKNVVPRKISKNQTLSRKWFLEKISSEYREILFYRETIVCDKTFENLMISKDFSSKKDFDKTNFETNWEDQFYRELEFLDNFFLKDFDKTQISRKHSYTRI